MNRFEEYEEWLRRNDGFSEWKKRVAEIIARKNLCPVMNDTKWLELQAEVEKLPFPPPFSMRCVTDKDDREINDPVDAPRYVGDWSSFWEEGLPPFFNIEWIRVRPRHGIPRGRLVADEVLDETEEFLAILAKLSIPYNNEDGIVMIYGYKPI